MKPNEIIEMIYMLQKLSVEKQKEIYFMVKGAALVADKSA